MVQKQQSFRNGDSQLPLIEIYLDGAKIEPFFFFRKYIILKNAKTIENNALFFAFCRKSSTFVP
jgi:hypothetical protein